MEITRQSALFFIVVFGPLVLLSYIYGVSRTDRPQDLWGGIPLSWQTYIIPFMFIAAAGFLIYWWTIFFKLDHNTFSALRWPWGSSDGKGANRILLAYCLILIPSALWLESTLFHLSNNYSWTPVLVIGILVLVAIGNIMIGFLAYGAYQDGVKGSGMMITGAVMLGIQCIVNDCILWSFKFPWKWSEIQNIFFDLIHPINARAIIAGIPITMISGIWHVFLIHPKDLSKSPAAAWFFVCDGCSRFKSIYLGEYYRKQK